MRYFNNLKTNLTLSSEVLNDIIRYHLIYKELFLNKKKNRK